MTEIAHKDTTYTFLVYAPPIARIQHGHYCAPIVALACGLLIFNVILQVSLTVIAGNYILNQNTIFLTTLVEGEAGRLWTLQSVTREILDPQHLWRRLQGKFKKEQNVSGCCRGAKCAASGAECCPSGTSSSDVAFAEHHSAPWNPAVSHGASLGLRQDRPASRAGTGSSAAHLSDPGSLADVALCTLANSSLDCSPSTYGMLGHWDDLDTDGDGVWTLHESQADAANLGCRFGVPPDEVLRCACRGVIKDIEYSVAHYQSPGYVRSIFAPPELPATIREKQGLPRQYFDVWSGLVSICASADPGRCNTLVRQGIFDGALAGEGKGTRGGIVDLETALSYCRWLFEPSGVCDVALPNNFRMYQWRVAEKCGKAVYKDGHQYKNPHDKFDAIALMDISYSNLEEYLTVHTFAFQFFLCLVLMMWYINLVDELKDVLDLVDFTLNFEVDAGRSTLPSSWKHLTEAWVGQPALIDSEAQRNVQRTDSNPLHYSVTESGHLTLFSVTRAHRRIIVFIAVVRTWLLLYLANVGTAFLLSTHSFADLLLNSVALAFIFELPEFLFRFLVGEDIKSEITKMDRLRFESSVSRTLIGRILHAKHMWGFIIIPIVSILQVYANDQQNTMPVLEALRCVCGQGGPRCTGSSELGSEWWIHYWANSGKLIGEVLPKVSRLARNSKLMESAVVLGPHALSQRSMIQASAKLANVTDVCEIDL